jgi:glutathione S-transferase
MKKLYHYPLCPFSRQIRMLLKEYSYEFSCVTENYWLRSPSFLSLSPSGDLPILVEPSGLVVSDIYSILQYLTEIVDDNILLPKILKEKIELWRLISWFNNKFYREVTRYIINEKLVRLFKKSGSPRSELIRAAKINLLHHLKYMTDLIEAREFLLYEKLSIIDFIAASHISIMDYFGEINWNDYPRIQHWYSLLKSRPSFRPILQDNIPGFLKPKHYELLDF